MARHMPIGRKGTHARPRSRQQSAMEYLMTYGWAILIIAVVLSVIYMLGLTNNLAYAPKVPPGSCTVYRSGVEVSLEGECQNGLPEYTVKLEPSPHANVSIPSIQNQLATTNNLTITAWINPETPYGTNCNPGGYQLDCGWIFSEYSVFGLATCQLGSGTIELCTYYWNEPGFPPSQGTWELDPNSILQAGNWYYVAAVLQCAYSCTSTSNGIETLYLNGNPTGTVWGVKSFGAKFWLPTIGGGCCNQNLQGEVANVQLYYTDLSPGYIQKSYLEGIGGDPIDLQDLRGWWPLNGNTNDYAGYPDNATSVNVIYNGQWYYGYSIT